MGKKIIFCADGTWNGPVDANAPDADAKDNARTNVYRLFANLKAVQPADDKLMEQERDLLDANGQPAGVAKYLHGVGDSTNSIVHFLGGAFGVGLIGRIVRGYTFISRNYAPGDDIIITGFSRGAYTARALAGLIAAKGVMRLTPVQWADKSEAYRLGVATWCDYQQENDAARPQGWFAHLLSGAVRLGVDIAALVTQAPRGNLAVDKIRAVGVWDTVGAMGIPLVGGDDTNRVFGFVDTKLSAKVQQGFHAVSLDEQRVPFTPTLWDPDPSRILQVLFPGAHSDVGGGYFEKGLSDNALMWMMNNLRTCGVVFDSSLTCPPEPNAADSAHEPWLGTLYPIKPRQFSKASKLIWDPSIKAREAAGPVKPDPTLAAVPYAPTNLP